MPARPVRGRGQGRSRRRRGRAAPALSPADHRATSQQHSCSPQPSPPMGERELFGRPKMTEPYDNELRDRFGLDVDLGGDAPDSESIRIMLLRRTQRRYTDDPVPDSFVRLLLAAAFSASSKSDFQQASVVWLKDRARRDRLAAFFPDMPWIGAAPVFLVFLGDARRLERLGALRGHEQDNGALEGFFNATVDAALALQTCILAAETLGLGTCPISVLRNHIKAVGEILVLPDKVFPVAGLCLGYPAQAGFVSMRLPLEAR